MLWAIRGILIACCVFIGFGSEPVILNTFFAGADCNFFFKE